ncbi:MAG: cytochrome c [Pseudomonadota bacterium]|nr:cytochrome c [Pseudomonadota bacterium]
MSTSERRPAARWRRTLMLLCLCGAAACPAQQVSSGKGRWLPAGSAPALGQPLVESAGAPPALIFGDGAGLPPGSGLAEEGAVLYQQECAACHGRHGEGNTAPELVGGEAPLSRPDADKTLLTYWPYAPTLFDTIRRSMPPARPGRLDDAQIYALCAWLLAQNGLWPAARTLDAAGLASVRMPNRDGFIRADER